MSDLNASPSLIGGIGMTQVTVYSQRPAPDGLNSGCPHLHALTDEAYYVLRGGGEVEFFDSSHGFRKLDLKPGMYVHFPPLVLHRIISKQDLVILGMMGNAGLAERGDARIYFGPAADADPAIYEELRSLPSRLGLEGALQRRDRAVGAYVKLKALWSADREAAGREFGNFVAIHLAAAATLREKFTTAVHDGPLGWGTRTLERLDALPLQGPPAAEVFFQPIAEKTAFGMCGILHPVTRLTALE